MMSLALKLASWYVADSFTQESAPEPVKRETTEVAKKALKERRDYPQNEYAKSETRVKWEKRLAERKK